VSADPHAAELRADLADDFAELTREVSKDGSPTSTLDAICRLAVDVVDGAEHAAITLVRGARFSTVATSSDVPPQVDKLQYTTRQGPCIDAIIEADSYRANDLAGEGRWPDFTAAVVRETGIRSMLSHRLFLREDTLAALNLYAARPFAFDDHDTGLAAIFAAHAALAYQAALDHERVDNLETALQSNRRIGMAIGILMAVRKVTADDAFHLMRRLSQQSHRKLAEIAEDVIFTGDLP
jgi:transcriptional regulator with GAF, ATPase, and Fis domain